MFDLIMPANTPPNFTDTKMSERELFLLDGINTQLAELLTLHDAFELIAALSADGDCAKAAMIAKLFAQGCLDQVKATQDFEEGFGITPDERVLIGLTIRAAQPETTSVH